MKTTIIFLLALCIGVFSGWYLGYTRPLIQYSREFCNLTGMNDAQLKEMYADSRTAMKTMEADDTSAVIHCTAALNQLEAGNTEGAKRALASPLASFYRIYGPPNRPGKKMSEERLKTLQMIERVAAKSPAAKRAIDEATKD